jgi:hypothetical protein
MQIGIPKCAGRDNHFIQWLRGLKAVSLELLSDPGTPADAVAVRTKQELLNAGIQLLKKDEWKHAANAALLFLNLRLACNNETCAYQVALELDQRVQLTRDINVTGIATTWKDSSLNSVGVSRRLEPWDEMAVDALVLIKMFVIDYQSVNPK